MKSQLVFLPRLCALIPLLALGLRAVAAERPAGAAVQSTARPSLSLFSWQSETQGAFVSSMARNAKTGEVWFGSEDQGVYRYDPRAAPIDKYESGRWSNFRMAEGLGDNNAYALAIDRQGRVWAGTRTHGVSVFNGKEWRPYDVLNGPLGERVFDLAISPLDGDVWIATNRGLTRYSQKSDTWRTLTRVDGLPSDQIQSIAFAKDGSLFVGTQCDGLAIGKAGDGYATWKAVPGPARMTPEARGGGLPSHNINDILVAHDGLVYVATPNGLARSRDNGASWQYLRGRDYADRIRGQYKRPNLPDIQEVQDEDMEEGARSNLLLEDYVTALAEDEVGRIWVGHPREGIEARSPGAEEFAAGGVIETPGEWREMMAKRGRNVAGVALGQDEKTDFVMSILPVPGEGPLVSAYGAGAIHLQGALFDAERGGAIAPSPLEQNIGAFPASTPALPSASAPPTVEELRALTTQIEAFNKPATTAPVRPLGAAFVGDDWITGGDWMGRYGTRYAFLGAMGAPLDHRVVNDLSYSVEGRIGPHPYQEGKSYEEQNLRHFCHFERWDDPRVLYNPLIGYRRQADVDDNGEAYPLSYEGPDVWLGVRVPAGEHQVALYFFNKDGHDANNRIRDYEIEVKRGHENLLDSEAEPTLARARVRDFWGGVYKKFILQGGDQGGDYYFVVRKGGSFNVVVQAVFLDKLSGPPTGRDDVRDVFLGTTRFESPAPEEEQKLEQKAATCLETPEQERLSAALALWKAVGASAGQSESASLQGSARVVAYRAAQTALGGKPDGEALLRSWRFALPLWPRQDRQEFTGTMKAGWESFIENNPYWTQEKH